MKIYDLYLHLKKKTLKISTTYKNKLCPEMLLLILLYFFFRFSSKWFTECVLLFKLLMGGEACTPIRRSLSAAKPKPTSPNERRRGAKRCCVSCWAKNEISLHRLHSCRMLGQERESERDFWRGRNMQKPKPKMLATQLLAWQCNESYFCYSGPKTKFILLQK